MAEYEDNIRVLYSEEEVDRRIRELGAQISRDYAGKSVNLIGILKGASFFMCELAKRITVPVYIDFMSVSSYGSGTESSGVVKINKDLDRPVEGLDVIIVEDIVDTGLTMFNLLPKFEALGTKSVRICTFLQKPEKLEVDLKVDYVAMNIPNDFIVGYGLDYNGMGRNYKDIYSVVDN